MRKRRLTSRSRASRSVPRRRIGHRRRWGIWVRTFWIWRVFRWRRLRLLGRLVLRLGGGGGLRYAPAIDCAEQQRRCERDVNVAFDRCQAKCNVLSGSCLATCAVICVTALTNPFSAAACGFCLGGCSAAVWECYDSCSRDRAKGFKKCDRQYDECIKNKIKPKPKPVNWYS